MRSRGSHSIPSNNLVLKKSIYFDMLCVLLTHCKECCIFLTLVCREVEMSTRRVVVAPVPLPDSNYLARSLASFPSRKSCPSLFPALKKRPVAENILLRSTDNRTPNDPV